MDPDLYDAYLKVNGIVYEDGLTEVEKETLKILESLTDIEKDGDVSVAAAKFEPIRMKIFWTQASVKISYVLVGGRASDTTIRVKASEGASAGMIYTDGIDAGVMSCEGSVNLYLVQDTSLASVEGSDTTTVKIGTYGSSAKKKLTTTGDVIANTLTIEKCTADGTKTLRLYGFFGAFGEASIHAGRLFGWQNVEASEASSVSIHDDMAWTAQFYVYGAVTGESEFQVAFTQEIPAGTDLTLAVKGDDGYTYYYYKVKTAARMVFLKDFAQMGTTKAAPVFTNGAYELLLAVDFAQATKEPSRGDATLQLVISGNVMDVATVSYEIETPELTKIQIRYGTGKSMIQTESIIDAPIRHADKDVYAIIVFDRQLPLNALIKLNGKTGKTIGGRAILFDLGEMSEWKDRPCILTCENLREGVNTVECYLAIVDETSQVNDPGKVFVNVIQYGTKGKLSITATKEEAEMKVAIKTMDGVETASRIVKGGSRIVFDIVENVDTISVTAYTADGTSAAQRLTYNVDTKTLSVAEDIPSGAYVVTFSFAEHVYDDVSFSFVVK